MTSSVLLILISLFFSSAFSISFYCTDYDNITDTCTINENLTFDLNSTNYIISYNTTILIINNSYITCSKPGLFNQCIFRVNASEVHLLNSTIYFAIIELNGSLLNISNSNLSTNGTIKNGLGRPNNCSSQSNDVGIGYAGSGAFCQDLNPQCGRPYGALNLLLNQTNDPDAALGSGSGQLIQDFYGCGGGRVFLNMTTIVFNGSNIISASGSPQKEPEYDCTKRDLKIFDILNGGTGGYVYIGARDQLTVNTSNDKIKVIVEGGNYCDSSDGKTTKFAGSGGRIIMDVEPSMLSNVKYSMKGGGNDMTVKQQNVNPCRNGASGSLYLSRKNTIVFNNDDFTANTITQIPSNQIFDQILITNGARGGPEDNNTIGNISAINITVVKAYLAYERFFTHLDIKCNNLSISGGKNNAGGIGPPEQNSKSTSLSINATIVEFSNNTMVQFGKEFNLTCINTTFNGSVQSYFFDSGLYISSENLFIKEAQIEVSTIAISTFNNLLIKNSKLKAFKQKCKDENYTRPYINFLHFDLDLNKFLPQTPPLQTLHYLIQKNYTFFILTPKNLTFYIENATDLTKNSIQGANIGLFAENINISSNFLISSEDLGCNNEQGLGKGTQDHNLGNKCGGTGGSFGGFGSLAWSNYTDILKDCLKIKSPSIYGDMFNPIHEGSGGGGNQERLNPGGKGGGVIIIAAIQNLTINGIITSSGSSPETQMGKATAGSGSGGSIQIFMEYLLGGGLVKSEGGSTQASGIGGSGGGGRIRVNFFNWDKQGFYSSNWTGQFSVDQGKRSDFISLPDDMNENMGKGSNIFF